MLRRATAYLASRYLIAASAAALVLAVPALGAASSGGGGLQGSGGSGTQSGNRSVSASANGVTITTRASGFLRRRMRFAGHVSRAGAGRVIQIQRYGRPTHGRWTSTAQAVVQSDGSFTAHWQVKNTGQVAFRALLGGASGGQSASAWPTVSVILYRVSVATIYGPGFWGSRTACGETLHRNTLGVANRTLPCGTRISLYYRGRTIRVPVIDRGPYANGADWDLTSATARALHMPGTERVGAAPLPRG